MIKLANIILLLMISYATYSFQNAFPVFDAQINVGDHKLHIVCQGKGSPTVILEAGSGTDFYPLGQKYNLKSLNLLAFAVIAEQGWAKAAFLII